MLATQNAPKAMKGMITRKKIYSLVFRTFVISILTLTNKKKDTIGVCK